MRKSIIILGSTGSIGTATVDILQKNKSKFNVLLLVAKNNYKTLYKQALILNAKNIYIENNLKRAKLKEICKTKKINIIDKFELIDKSLKKKSDLLMSAISGLDGLKYNLQLIKKTKKILFANKESIICGWNLIKKKLLKHKTSYIPIDSEHFAIHELIKKANFKEIKNIYITASGGPFLKTKTNQLKSVSSSKALKHPKWKMGKKISIDSATLMNKVFEVMEAYRLFDIKENILKIIIHPESCVHAIINYKNGISHALMHNTNMKIPIISSMNVNKINFPESLFNFKIEKLSNFNFLKIDKKKFPSINILNHVSYDCRLFDTVLVSANDELVKMFLNNEIKFLDIVKKLTKIIKLKELKKYKYIKPKNFAEISNLNNYVRLKIRSLCIR